MDEKKLEEMYRLVHENNAMLKSARRSAFIGGIVKAVWWVVVLIILPYFTWLYIQPYLDTAVRQYDALQARGGAVTAQAEDVQRQLEGLRSQANGFMDLLKKFGFGAE